MDKIRIANYLMKKSKYTEEQKHLINSIDKAREDLNSARHYFNAVNEPRLVDYAIYMEEAAKAKYMYLLNEAKKSGLKIEGDNMLREVSGG
jgi:hypothetical protein